MCVFVAIQMPEELTLDYAEITSIPPLPLWTLLDADKELTGMVQQNEEVKVSEGQLMQEKYIAAPFLFRITTSCLTTMSVQRSRWTICLKTMPKNVSALIDDLQFKNVKVCRISVRVKVKCFPGC